MPCLPLECTAYFIHKAPPRVSVAGAPSSPWGWVSVVELAPQLCCSTVVLHGGSLGLGEAAVVIASTSD